MRTMLRAVGRGIPVLVAAIAMVHPLSRLGARHSVLLDLVTHFQEPAFLATCLAAILFARRSRRIAIAFLVLAVFQLEPIYRYSLPNSHAGGDGSSARLRILVANVLVDNHDHGSLASLIRRVDPDIVGLVEYSQEWAVAMRDFSDQYPYRIEAPQGFQGLALWFKKPPARTEPARRPTAEGWPYLHATVGLDGKERHIWLLHPSTPFHRSPGDNSFREIHAIAQLIRETGGSTIVMGDLNVTDGSPHFQDFLDESGLRDTRLGFGRQRTWPVDSPYQIAIDHILTTPDWMVLERRRERKIGSDHYPLLIDLSPFDSMAARASATAVRNSSPGSP